MISRKHRFHGYGSLKYVYQNGKTVRGPLTALKFTTNPRRNDFRLAVVVSKKVNKSAVVRNRIRRRVYEAARRQLIDNQPYDLVLTVFSEQLATMSPAELDELLSSQFVQISSELVR